MLTYPIPPHRIASHHPLPQYFYQAVILSDRLAGPDRLPVPSLLAVGAVHQHLLTTKQRLKGAIFAEMGDAREVHDMATLIGCVLIRRTVHRYAGGTRHAL